MGKKVKITENNKLSIDSDNEIVDSYDIANCLNSHFVRIDPRLASETPLNDTTMTPESYMARVPTKFEFQKIDSKNV